MAAVHGLVRQAVGYLIVFAEGVANFEMFKPPDQLLGLVIELAQFRMAHLVNAFHLPDHQFGITNHIEGAEMILGSVA